MLDLSYCFYMLVYVGVPVQHVVAGESRCSRTPNPAAAAPYPRTMSASYLRRWPLQALLFLAVMLRTLGDCPKPCACYGPTEVHCTFRYLSAVPDGIQPAAERINLG